MRISILTLNEHKKISHKNDIIVNCLSSLRKLHMYEYEFMESSHEKIFKTKAILLGRT